MTNEQTQLLIKDLCARLPYGVRVKQGNWEHTLESANMYSISFDSSCAIPIPYLRPMSSMTEEEKSVGYSFMEKYQGFPDDTIHINKINDYQDWLNKKMFDHRGLIPMGLALEAPKDMYK